MKPSSTVDTLFELPGAIRQWWYSTSGSPSRLEVTVLFGGVPTVLIAVWLFPVGEEWAFSLGAESVFADGVLARAFTSNLLHVDGHHLLDNVVNYLVTVFAIYPLVVIAGWYREFLASVAAYALVGPVAIGWLMLSTLGSVTNQPSMGFSGLNTALLGFLLVVLFVAASEATDGTISPLLSIAPFSIAIGAVLALPHGAYFPVRPVVGAGCVLFGFVAIVVWYRSIEEVSLPPVDERLALVVGGIVLAFGTVGALFFGGTDTNLWGHVGGYVLGFSTPYLGFVLSKTLIGTGRSG